MKNIQTKIELAIFGYDPQKFMPIRVEGRLANRAAFVRYKLKNLVH